MKSFIILSTLSLILSSCAHSLHQYSVSNYSKKIKTNSKKIQVETKQYVMFYFASNTDYVDRAYSKLQRKCKGEISGINTRYSTSLGFFSWTNKIHIEAYCLN